MFDNACLAFCNLSQAQLASDRALLAADKLFITSSHVSAVLVGFVLGHHS